MVTETSAIAAAADGANLDASHAPTNHALRFIGDMLVHDCSIDLFTDRLSLILSKGVIYSNMTR
jgi:hypothetical protein